MLVMCIQIVQILAYKALQDATVDNRCTGFRMVQNQCSRVCIDRYNHIKLLLLLMCLNYTSIASGIKVVRIVYLYQIPSEFK